MYESMHDTILDIRTGNFDCGNSSNRQANRFRKVKSRSISILTL
jgi:hypothetical protein